MNLNSRIIEVKIVTCKDSVYTDTCSSKDVLDEVS